MVSVRPKNKNTVQVLRWCPENKIGATMDTMHEKMTTYWLWPSGPSCTFARLADMRIKLQNFSDQVINLESDVSQIFLDEISTEVESIENYDIDEASIAIKGKELKVCDLVVS